MKANFRQVYVFNVDVVSQRKDAVLPSLSELVAIWERQRATGKAHLPIENGDIDLALAPVIVDPVRRTAALLMRYSDKHAADSAYSSIIDGTFTPHPKKSSEGGETGIHIFMSLDQEKGMPGRYTCLIERVPNITVALLRRFLNQLIRNEYASNPNSFTYDHPAGQRTRKGDIAQVRCLPRLEFEGRPSEKLAQDIQNGRLTGLVLKKAIPKSPLGGVPFLNKSEATLKIQIDHGNMTSNIWGDVRKALAAEAKDYPIAQVGVRLPGKTRSVSVLVDSAHGAPLTELYTQSFDVSNISPPMAQSAEKVAIQLSDRVAPLLLQLRNV